MEIGLKYSNVSVVDFVPLNWNTMTEENESLRLPNVNTVTPAVIIIDSETNEIHIDDKIIRLPVDYITSTEGIQKVDVGIDSPLYLRSLPLNLETIVTLSSDSPQIEEGNVQQFTFGELANLVHIDDFTTNMYSFWILDTLGTLIWEIRKKNMSVENQSTFINWFFYFIWALKYTNLPRKEFFRVMKPFFIRTDEWMNINLTTTVPLLFGKKMNLPLKIKKKQKAMSTDGNVGEAVLKKPSIEHFDRYSLSQKKSKQSQIFFLAGSEVFNMGQDLNTYAEQIYNVFSGRLEYEIIREVFWNEPIIEIVQLSDRIMIPKPLKSKPELPSVMQGKSSSQMKAASGSDKQQSKKKSISGGSRKSVTKKSVSRKSVSGASDEKSRKSVSRKSVSRKSVTRKSVTRKSVSGNTAPKKNTAGQEVSKKDSKDKKTGEKLSTKKASSARHLETLARAMAEKARREEITCLQFLKDAVDPNFVKDLFGYIDFHNLPDKWKKFIIEKGIDLKDKVKGGGERRQSTKKHSTKKQSTRRQSARRQSAKGNRRQSKK